MRFVGKLAVFFVFTVFISSQSAIADNMAGFAMSKLATVLCKSVKANDLIKMRSTLLKARVHISNIYADINCDGSSLLQIARKNQSVKVINYLKLRVESKEFWPSDKV